ncbi:MAG: DUF2062 domain-containing protein [Anaerohalosphaeraceae bacterium]
MKFRILHVDDTPERIARGVAVGLLVAFSPWMGFHMIIAVTLAALCRGNKALAALMVWLSNPFTVLPVYGPCYMVGRFIVGLFRPAAVSMDLSQIADMLGGLFTFSKMLTCLHSAEFWKDIAVVFGKIGLEITIGGFVIGSLAAASGYFMTYSLVLNYRAKKGRRRFRQNQ